MLYPLLLRGIAVSEYYSKKLYAERLKQCYELAPPRTQQYLRAEVQHILNYITPHSRVLELGCGFGRVLAPMMDKCSHLVGIDISRENLSYAQSANATSNLALALMNAQTLAFADGSFDVVVCIQNGISAFKLPPHTVIQEAVRVAASGGVCLFSSYSERFWDTRLEWFKVQSEAGLIGPIDWEHTKDGTIVCTDGFRAKTLTRSDFAQTVDLLGLDARIQEIDESSIFCEIIC